jgi:ribosomal protein S18 acetylase RimI-like enzyme
MTQDISFHELTTQTKVLLYTDIIKQLLPDSSTETISNSMNMLMLQGSAFLGITLKDLPIAFVQYTITTDLEANGILKLDEIVVTSAYQDQGIGSQIMQHLEVVAQQNDCEFIFLIANKNNDRAHKFYFNCDYTLGSLKMYKKIV